MFDCAGHGFGSGLVFHSEKGGIRGEDMCCFESGIRQGGTAEENLPDCYLKVGTGAILVDRALPLILHSE